MAFIKRTTVKGHTYCQLVQTYREGGKVKQRMLAHLGKEFIGKNVHLNKKVAQALTEIDDGRELRAAYKQGFKFEMVRTPGDSSLWDAGMICEALNKGKARVVTGKKTAGGFYWYLLLKQLPVKLVTK